MLYTDVCRRKGVDESDGKICRKKIRHSNDDADSDKSGECGEENSNEDSERYR